MSSLRLTETYSQIHAVEISCSSLIVGFVLSYIAYTYFTKPAVARAPVVGHRNFFEPAWMVRLRFIRSSREMIEQGYKEVIVYGGAAFRDSMFKIRRIGTDVLVLSPQFAEQVRVLSRDKVRSVEPFIHDFCGEIVKGTVFLESDLQNRVVQQKLTPSLAALTTVFKDELDYALARELSALHDDKWTKIDVTARFTRIIARISARVFLGLEHGRNEEWLQTTAEYTENLFITGMILRNFPTFCRPWVAFLLPSYRQLLRNVSAARRIIGAILVERVKEQNQEVPVTQDKTDNILQWMYDAANEDERKLDNFAQRILILSLSSIHTTALTMTQALYDLCAHPQFLEPIRAEVLSVLHEDGDWQSTTLTRLNKLDSTLKESQRMNPIFLFTFNRIYHEPMTLSNGTHLPRGTRVAVPAHAMLNDKRHVPGPASPAVFDAFRYSNLREDPSRPENMKKYLLAMTDPSNMAFGYGRYACPGRFYATNEMKLVLAHLLLRYEFTFLPGRGRPKNFTVDTDMYPDRSARLLVRERSDIETDVKHLILGPLQN